MTVSPQAISEWPWSVPIRVDEIPETGQRVTVIADERTRMALAPIVGVDAVLQLEAIFELLRRGRDGVQVIGTVTGRVGQTCVVTLEPIENDISEAVDLTFVPRGAEATVDRVQGIVLHGTEEPEPPEALNHGTVDLGKIATEFFLLGIDRYPRKPGAQFASPATEEAGTKPFAALAALRDSVGKARS